MAAHIPQDGPLSPRTEPPASILAAVSLMYVGAGLSLIGLIFDLAARDEIRDQLTEQSATDVGTAVNVTLASLIVTGLLAVGMWIWMAQTNRRGLAWARIVAVVLGGLNVAFTLFSAAQSAGFGIVIKLVTIALAGAVLFLLYRPDSTLYYDVVARRTNY